MDNVNEIQGQETQVPTDEMVPKERVTEIVQREKEAAYRKAQREIQSQYEQQAKAPQNMGGMAPQGPSQDEMYQEVVTRLRGEIAKAQEESQKADYEAYVKDQVSTFLNKMSKADGIADDFQEMTSQFKPERFREVFYLANEVENTPELIYEFMQNPHKLGNIDYLAKTDPDLARRQIAAISKSIEANKLAKSSNQTAPSPLNRPKASLTAGADSGAVGLKELKKASWLRG
jgi:hypothetical protein